jgi:hypothetical protein
MNMNMIMIMIMEWDGMGWNGMEWNGMERTMLMEPNFSLVNNKQMIA